MFGRCSFSHALKKSNKFNGNNKQTNPFSFNNSHVGNGWQMLSNPKPFFSSFSQIHSKKTKHELSLEEYWDNTANQRYFLDKLFKKLNFKTFEDWYNLPSIELIRLGGGPILARHSSSIPQTLQSLYPSHHFNTVYSSKTFFHNSFWTSNENLRHYFDYLACDVRQLPNIESWYFLPPIELNNLVGGKILFQRSNDNIFKSLQLAYPEMDWDLYRSTITHMISIKHNPLIENNSDQISPPEISPNEFAFKDNFWESVDYQRRFLDDLKPILLKHVKDNKLNPVISNSSDETTTDPEDDTWIWYHLNNEILRNNGGNGLLLHYNNNLSDIFPNVYPEIDWNIYYFALPKHFWRTDENCRQFITFLFKKLNLNMEEMTTEYQKISAIEVRRLGGIGLLSVYGRLFNALRMLYPSYTWPESFPSPSESQNTNENNDVDASLPNNTPVEEVNNESTNENNESNDNENNENSESSNKNNEEETKIVI